MRNQFKLKRVAAGVLLSMCASSSVFASDDEDDAMAAISLEDLLNIEVVSATRSESKLSESPAPISVITAREIAASGLDNIPDVLARLAEVDVLRIGASQTEVSIRGKGIIFNRRLLVMIDGRTEYNDLFGVTLWNAFPIAMDDIERIEVVRGPASALFGANAYSGVINIITKSVDKTGGLVRYHTGQDNRHYANVRGQYAGDGFNAKLSVTQQNLDNEDSDVMFNGYNRYQTSTNFAADENSLDWVTKANAHIMFTPDESWDVKLGYGMTEGGYELFQQPGLPRSNWDIDTDYLHFITNYRMDDGPSLQLNIYQNTFDYATPLVPSAEAITALLDSDPTNGYAYYPHLATPGIYEGKVETFDATFQAVGTAFDDKMKWVAGTEIRDIENKGGLVLDRDKDITSYFANFTYRLKDDWQIGAGYRIDDDSVTGNDDGYTLSVSHFLNDTDSIRFTARSAFRAPSLFELYSQVDLVVPGQNQNVSFVGAELVEDGAKLEVETITSMDITYTANITETMQLTVEWYHEEYENIIGNPDSGLLQNVVIDGANNQFFTTTSFQNQAITAESTGIQLGVVWIASESLSTYANYRYSDPKNLNSVAGETFFTPENKINFGGNWRFADAMSLDFNYSYVSKTDPSEFKNGNVAPDGPNFTRDRQETYATLNLSLRYQATDDLSIYLSAYNALDDEHVEYYEYDQVLKGAGETFGRSIWGGVSWTF